MGITAHATDKAANWLDDVAATLFYSSEVPGVVGRTGLYEDIVDALNALLSTHRPATAEIMRFPPVMSRASLEKQGYQKSSPDQLGCVGTALGAADCAGDLLASDLVLTPAACYPAFPILARRGPVRAGGTVLDVACECFRREPSSDIDRSQSFRMREFLCIGTPLEVHHFREEWMIKAGKMADSLGLPHAIGRASDPFFGRGGKIVALKQIQQSLKFELLVRVISPSRPSASMSFSYHRDHFGETWGIRTHDEQAAHSACVSFGLDRLAVALFATHGLEPASWPDEVRTVLQLG